MRAAIGDPNLTDAQVAGLFISHPRRQARAARRRTSCACWPRTGASSCCREIRAQFEALKNEREGVVEAEVHSAFELTEAQVADLVQRLEKKTGRKVKDQGQRRQGADRRRRVVLGDKVIDGSARAQLGALETALKA